MRAIRAGKRALGLAPIAVPTVSSSSWKMLATGDFNGDGLADLFWRYEGGGYVVVWEATGSTLAQAPAALGNLTAVNFKISGIADYNGDSQSDILTCRFGCINPGEFQ